MSEDKTILVVDDNEMNRDMLSRRLNRQGFTVEMAEHGQMALEMLAERPYALLLLDVMMPRMNGYEVLEYLKSHEATRHIPVIMISAVDDLDSVVKCIELGADDYLFKPFNPILLKARVQASLRRAEAASHALSAASVTEALAHLEAALPPLQELADAQTMAHLEAIHTILRNAIVD
jgi:adenylate cyclase